MESNDIREAIFEAFEALKARNELKEFIKAELMQAVNSFPNHKGRPGQIGGSLPKDENAGFFKKWDSAPTISLNPPSEWESIEDIEKLRDIAEEYLKNTLRNIPLERKEIGKIRFSKKSVKEFNLFE